MTIKRLTTDPYAIKEKALDYDRYTESMRCLTEFLDGYRETGTYSSEESTLGVPNWLTSIKGYGLKVKRDILRIELKEAKLMKEAEKKVADLESKLNKADKKLTDFLASNLWVVL